MTRDIEILALRHQLLVLQRQVGKPAFTDTDRVVLAGLLHRLPRQRLCQLLLLVRPDTVLRWHRDLIKRRHAATCAEAARTPAHGPLDPRPGPAPGPREPLMGVPQNPRSRRRHRSQPGMTFQLFPPHCCVHAERS